MTDKPLTFIEFYKEKTGYNYPGVSGEHMQHIYQRMTDVFADYVDYRVELKLGELDRGR